MSNVIQCRQCRLERTCGCFFDLSTFAQKPLQSGMKSALCVVCHARDQGITETEIDATFKEQAFEINQHQEQNH